MNKIYFWAITFHIITGGMHAMDNSVAQNPEIQLPFPQLKQEVENAIALNQIYLSCSKLLEYIDTCSTENTQLETSQAVAAYISLSYTRIETLVKEKGQTGTTKFKTLTSRVKLYSQPTIRPNLQD